jgi:signal transduction histidine kinase
MAFVSQFQSRLWRKYATFIASLMAGGLLMLGISEMVIAYRDTLAETRLSQQRVAAEVSYALRLTLGGIESQLAAVAVLPWQHADWMGLARRREEFHRLLLLMPALRGVRLLATDGEQLLKVSRQEPDEIADRATSAAGSPSASGATAFEPRFQYGTVQYSGGYEPEVELKLSVPDRSAQLTEASIGLRALVRGLRQVLSPVGLVVYVVDGHERIVMHVDPAVMLAQRVRKVPAADQGEGLNGRPALIAEAAVPGLDWRVVVERPRDEALAPVKETLWRTAAFIVVGLFAAVASSLLLARRMTLPIAALQSAANSVGRGDLDVRITLRTHDELEDLATQFNRMAASLQASYTDLEDKVTARTLALQQATHHKSEFLANMSHELRTPLNAILGFADVLREGMAGPLSDDQREYIADIHASGLHLLALINDVLDLSKIEAGQLDLERSDFSVPDTVASAVALVRQRALQKNLALQVEVAPTLGLWHADERRFKQVLLNLLSNAVKFTPDGGRVTVQAGLSDDPREGLWVGVQDTGIGIAATDHEAVFQEFRQVGGDSAGRAEGTGLGLALARRLVEQHGGCITLHSEPGAGSCFRFNIPGSPA